MDWVKQMKKNLAFGEKNCLDISGGKIRLVRPFIRQEFWKCIGCILSAVTYGKKGHNIWGGLKYWLINRNELNHTEMFVGTHIY